MWRFTSALAVATILAAHLLAQARWIPASLSPVRDGARYVQFALRLGEENPLVVCRTADDHPGYPALLATAFRVAGSLGGESPEDQLLSARLATSLCGLALALTSYFALRRMFGADVAWIAALCLVTLPRPAQTFADILSDPLHAALWMGALGCLARGADGLRAPWLATAGLLAGAAYWARADALSLPAATGAAAGAAVLSGRLRAGSVLRACVAFFVPLAAVFAGFGLLCGRLSTKPSTLKFLFGEVTCLGGPPLALAIPLDPGRLLAVPWHLLHDLAQEVQFLHVGTAVLGAAALWRTRTGRGASPAAWVLGLGVVTHLGAIAAVDLRYGYLAGRYFLPLLPILLALGVRFALNLAGSRRGVAAIALLAGSLLCSLPSTFKAGLRDQTHGQLQAGRWAAIQAKPGDTIFDPYFYPTYLAGARDRLTRSQGRPPGSQRHFVILEDRDWRRYPEAARLIAERRLLPAASFPRRAGGEKQEVTVYEAAKAGSGAR